MMSAPRISLGDCGCGLLCAPCGLLCLFSSWPLRPSSRRTSIQTTTTRSVSYWFGDIHNVLPTFLSEGTKKTGTAHD